jgi:tetratricopeptide (TPR) repeat protein
MKQRHSSIVVFGLAAAVMFAAPGSSLCVATQMPAAINPDPVQVAIDHYRNLEHETARQQLEAWLTNHPGDLRARNYLVSVILQRELLRRELLESQVYGPHGEAFQGKKVPVSPAFQQELFSALSKAESIAGDRLRQNPRDEEALYWAGVAHVTRAIYELTLAKANLAALGEVKEARKYHAQLLSLNPNFVDALLVVGTYDYVVGSLPWYLKVLASLIGYRGNRERGLAAIERVTREGHWARDDAKNFLAILYFREKRYPEARALLEDLARSYPRNYLFPQEIARTYKAQGDWTSAAKVYDEILAKHTAGEPGFKSIPAAKIYYQAGQAHDGAGETEAALERYDQAAKFPDNDIYVYRAELAAAKLCLQQNRRAEALRKYERVATAIPETDEGKAARRTLERLQQHPPQRGS